jgi:hypothetical protein
MRLDTRRLFFIILFFGLFLMTLRPVTDPDFWWHLRTGQLIVETHVIPHADPFSFTKAGKPWIAHEWLTELFLYGLYRLGSYGLLIFVFSAIITGAFLLAYLRSPRESRPYVAGFATLLGAIATAPIWGVRPQMISLLIMGVFLFLLDRYVQQNKLKFLIPLPLIMLVWVNLHAEYFLGLVVTGVYLLGGVLDVVLSPFSTKEAGYVPNFRPTLFLSGTLGACVLATLANPNGFHILLYPFQTLTSQAMQQFIQEWFSPDFHQLMWQPLAWMILGLIGAGMLTRKPLSATNILLVLGFGYAALRSMRHVPLFAIVAIPVLAEQVGSLVHIRPQVHTPSRPLRWVIPSLLAVLALVIGLRLVQVVQGQPKAETETFPVAAVDWIQANETPANLFNTYSWGGYLIWRLYPQYRVYIDGRADVYGDEFIYDYLSIYRADPGWERKLDDQQVGTVLIDPGAPLAKALRQSSTWELVFEDATSVVFTHITTISSMPPAPRCCALTA